MRQSRWKTWSQLAPGVCAIFWNDPAKLRYELAVLWGICIMGEGYR